MFLLPRINPNFKTNCRFGRQSSALLEATLKKLPEGRAFRPLSILPPTEKLLVLPITTGFLFIFGYRSKCPHPGCFGCYLCFMTHILLFKVVFFPDCAVLEASALSFRISAPHLHVVKTGDYLLLKLLYVPTGLFPISDQHFPFTIS